MKNILTPDQVTKMMVDLGLERYLSTTQKATDKGQVSNTKPGQVMLDTAVKRFSDTLTEWLMLSPHKVGPKHSCLKYLQLIPPEVIAFITSQTVVDNLTLQQNLQSSSLAIANALEDEVRFKQVKKKIPEEWNKITKRWKFTHEGHRKRVIKAAVNRIDNSFLRWPLVDKYSLGMFLLEFFAATTGFIEIGYQTTGPKRRKAIIRPTNEVLKWLADSNDSFKAKFPFFLPTVEPPEDWVGSYEGGYKANLVCRLPLVHQFNKNVKHQEPKDAPEVFKAVNTLQKVPWRINEFVWEVFNYYWTNGIGVVDIPGHNLRELPPKPLDIDTNEVAKKEWKKKAHAIYNYNSRVGSKKILYGKIHFIARHYSEQDFWFPYKLDFRGRAYPIPAFLNPQGCPLAKGLLRFSQGKQIKTDEARGWFFIHGANTWGLDKVSFEDRIKWVKDNEKAILEVYNDPISNRWWEDADSPWQFLAWCEEFGKWKEDPNILSYLPVSMDGTNNGLQIYSLLLRDPVGAAATNVAPTHSPRDIYQEVANNVTERLINETDPTKREMADNWLRFCNGKIPRAATKRPVMVLPYGGTSFSIREYLEEWYEDEIIKRNLEFNRPFPTTFNHTRYLCSLILCGIADVLIGAVKGMKWLREIADLASEKKAPLIWISPTGFKVYQASVNYSKVTIRTQLGKIHRKRSVLIPEQSLSKRGQSNGFSPNFIHSLDAAIMMKTANSAAESGITALSMIHDSFGTHAADCAALARILREETVSIFDGRNLLEELKDQIQSYLPGVEFPEIPEMGSFNVKEVLESKYFFA